MTAMGVQLQPFGTGLEPYGSWNFGTRQLRQSRAELEAALFQTPDISDLSNRLLEISKVGIAGCRSRRTPKVAAVLGPLEKLPSVPEPTEVCWRLLPSTFHPSLVFSRPRLAENFEFSFAQPSPAPKPPRLCLKRRRPDTDVDGPNTSELPCKKRRLRRELVTSRLAQPFSLPAPSVLNRDALTSGDKRITKIAAIMSARRLHGAAGVASRQPNPSTWLRRAAVLNSLRARVCAAAAERVSVPFPDLADKAAAFRQSHGSTAFVGGRFLVDVIQPLRAAVGVVARPTSSPIMAPTSGNPTPYHPAPAQTCLRIPSPKLRPMRSPELRVSGPFTALDDMDDLSVDDDSMAFPTSELESRYEDDLDDEDDDGTGVYADFSVIFGGSGGQGDSDDESGSSGSDSFEDYLDDLDGIPAAI
ncbi:hypothetical protein VTJ04DRAFT_35 [Mycothermus thermophilus]|uniref:uncharacterized protein n=1 Tax=Humicola insolens TaxID=85995 RepID=UPI0037443F55